MAEAAFNPDQFLSETAPAQTAGFDPDKFLSDTTPEKPSSLGQSIMGALGTASKAINSVTIAPVDAGIYAAQNGKPIWPAIKNQFANMDEAGPTGADIAAKAGFSTQRPSPYDPEFGYTPGPGNVPPTNHPVSPAQAAGMGIDLAANPLNLAGPMLKIVGKVGELATPLADSLNDFSTERALKAAGAMKKDFNIIQAKGTQEDLGNFLLNNKIVTPVSTLSKVADRISDAKETAGQTIGNILDTADASGAPKISAKDIALNLSEDPEIKQLATIPGKEGTANQINKFIETLYNHPEGDGLSLRDAQQLRQGIDSSINFNKRVPEMAGAQPYLFKMRDAISNAMNDSVNALPDGGDLDRLKTANASYSKLATLDKIAQNRLGALSSNEQISLGDKVAAGVGAVAGHGNPLAAIGIGALNKTARAIGNSAAATGASKLSNIISAIPQAASNAPAIAGPVASVATQALSPQNNGGQPPMSQQLPPQSMPQQVVPQPGAQPMPSPQAPPTAPGAKLGPDKWAADGFQNMKSHVNDADRQFLQKYQDAMMVDPKAKQQLITASSYSPGSKPLDDVLKNLKKQFGGK